MRKAITVLLLFIISNSWGQEIDLETCINGVKTNYPLIKQNKIQEELSKISKQINNNTWLPQFSIGGQLTTQSDVTSLDITIPNVEIEKIDKNQYKSYLDVKQIIYDGGVNSIKNDIQNLFTDISSNKTEIEIRSIIEQTQKYFFTAIIAQENIIILNNSKLQIEERIKILEAGVKYGSVKENEVNILRVELLNINQKITESSTTRKSSISVINLFAGTKINDSTLLKVPTEVNNNDFVDFSNRPEFKSFDFEKKVIEKETLLKNSSIKPTSNLFGQLGYGKPALNQLNNNPDTYYIAGIRVTWDFSGLYSFNKNKKKEKLMLENVDVKKETFELNLNVQKNNLLLQLDKIDKLIDADKDIVQLRTKITKVSAAELDNGIITATNYLIEKNAETNAIQTLKIHELQRVATQYDIKLLTGN
ncbi:MAG: TolC family protein [Flavobacterium sp.]|nr:TolC family protein [Flavobacterium sp.]